MTEDGDIRLNFENTNFKLNGLNPLENIKINGHYHFQWKLKWVLEDATLKDSKDSTMLF